MDTLPQTGFLRLHQIIGNPKANPPISPIIPVAKSTWYAGVKAGRFPKPVQTLGPRLAIWRAEDIRDLVRRLGGVEEHAIS
jgi:hypothetical protein